MVGKLKKSDEAIGKCKNAFVLARMIGFAFDSYVRFEDVNGLSVLPHHHAIEEYLRFANVAEGQDMLRREMSLGSQVRSQLMLSRFCEQQRICKPAPRHLRDQQKEYRNSLQLWAVFDKYLYRLLKKKLDRKTLKHRIGSLGPR